MRRSLFALLLLAGCINHSRYVNEPNPDRWVTDSHRAQLAKKTKCPEAPRVDRILESSMKQSAYVVHCGKAEFICREVSNFSGGEKSLTCKAVNL